MTRPKRRVGNPLGESGVSKEEEAAWKSAHFRAKQLNSIAQQAFAYFSGEGGMPNAHQCLTTAAMLLSEQETALGLRRGRRSKS